MASQPWTTSQEVEPPISDEQRQMWKNSFYLPKLPENIDVARRILRDYSGIPENEIDSHILKIRDQGWAIFPFPCIGQFRFLEIERTLSDARFQAALKRLQRPESTDRFLDVGCFVGQIARALAFSGVDTEKLYGTDLEQAYLDLGFDLFRDEHKMHREHFVAGDMLQEPRDPRLDAFVGKITLINASSFFHLFDLPQQIKAAKRCVEFLDRDAEDAMIFGRMTGRAVAGLIPGPAGSKLFVHNAESWAQLWKEVGELTGTNWRTEYELLNDVDFETANQKFSEAGVKRSRFGAYRVKSR